MTSPRDLESELLRAVLSTTAHDLGGLASALALRADVFERTTTSDGSVALRRIADELRALGYDVRAFRSAAGGDTLSPSRSGLLPQWLARVQRFGRPVLPRGSTLEGSVPDVMLEAATGLELTYVTLAILQQIASETVSERVTVRIDARVQGSHVVISVEALAANERLRLPGDVEGEWWQWALGRASGPIVALHSENGRVLLTVRLLPEK